MPARKEPEKEHVTDRELEGRSAVVTGASRGIGRAIAMELVHAGAHVILVARGMSDLESVRTAIEASGGYADTVVADLQTEEGVRHVLASVQTLQRFPAILVNNAARVDLVRALDLTDEVWRETHRLNVQTPLFLARDLGRRMVRAGWGRIINITSAIARHAVPSAAAYSVSKAALLQLTKVMAVELATTGVTVNAVSPGFIDTMMTDDFTEDERMRRWALNHVPMCRFGDVTDVARCVRFLAHPASGFITGHELAVDGGWGAT